MSKWPPNLKFFSTIAQALGDVLKDYYVFVAQLETQHRLGELTLNKVWSYIQPTMDAMAFMADLCATIGE